MAFTPSSQRKVSSEINVTPMIDVLLVLLIIFMVIHPATKVGETADIPHPSKSEITTPPSTVVIGLHDAGEGKMPTIEVNKEEIGWNDLRGRLQDIYKFREQNVVFLKSDAEVEFQFVADVVDATHMAGIDHVALLASKD